MGHFGSAAPPGLDAPFPDTSVGGVAGDRVPPGLRNSARVGAYASGLTALRQLVLVQRHTPCFNALVHLVLVLEASGERGELRCGGPRWMAHHLHQVLPLRVSMADNH